MKNSIAAFAAACAFAPALALATGNSPMTVTAQTLNQNPGNYIGQRVMIMGQIDRKLGNGAYLINDPNTTSSRDSAHQILVFTSATGSSVGSISNDGNNQAGVLAPNLKQGDLIQLTGKVEQVNVSDESDSFSPRSDTETIRAASANFPVIVARPTDMKLQR